MQTGDEQRQAAYRVSADREMHPAHVSYRSSRARANAKPRSFEGRLLQRVLAVFGNPRIAIDLWNGERVYVAHEPPLVSFKVADRTTLMRLCRDADMNFGEAYCDGAIDVDGDLGVLLEELYRSVARPAERNAITLARRFAHALHRRPANTVHGSRDNIHHHYDIGNAFYALWLGETMAYTCAYYPRREATLDHAQRAKMDHVCRKLRLQRDHWVAEAGCGWGSLALHMAQHYGARVRAFNISRQQLDYARAQARRLGLSRRVEFVEDDYRNITGQYDAFVSVGMLEHVGIENYPALGELLHRILKPAGLGLIHTIGRNRFKPMHRWIDRRIFPGANPPSLRQMMDIFEGQLFSVLDVENLRLHYAHTLAHWLERFEASSEQVAHLFDERFVRMWRLYLHGSAAAFRSGEMQLFQVLFAHQRHNGIPWTRADIYRPESSEQ